MKCVTPQTPAALIVQVKRTALGSEDLTSASTDLRTCRRVRMRCLYPRKYTMPPLFIGWWYLYVFVIGKVKVLIYHPKDSEHHFDSRMVANKNNFQDNWDSLELLNPHDGSFTQGVCS